MYLKTKDKVNNRPNGRTFTAQYGNDQNGYTQLIVNSEPRKFNKDQAQYLLNLFDFYIEEVQVEDTAEAVEEKKARRKRE